MRWAVILCGCAAVSAAACSSADGEVPILFSDASALAHTTQLAVTALEPFRYDEDVGGGPIFLECGDLGVFDPSSLLHPGELDRRNDHGRVLGRAREAHPYPLDGEWTLEVPKIREGDPSNPWGAVMLHIEARGRARVREPDSDRDSEVTATLLAGCRCFRARDPDAVPPSLRTLDQKIRRSCPLLDDEEAGARPVRLEAVVPSMGFELARCGSACLTAAEGEPTTSDPVACAKLNECNAQVTSDCFECRHDCTQKIDRSEVPILFTLSQNGAEVASLFSVTDSEGEAPASLELPSCTPDTVLRAHVFGTDAAVELPVTCVPRVESFACESDIRLSRGSQPIAFTRVESPPGTPDVVAILSDSGGNSILELFNPRAPNIKQELLLEGETALAALGFQYDLQTPSPALAVATSIGGEVRLRIYTWSNGQLVQNGATLPGRCASSLCTPPAPCMLDTSQRTELRIAAGDLDKDGRADLALGTSVLPPMLMYFSSQTSAGALYSETGCVCSSYGRPPEVFAIADLGSDPEISGPARLDFVFAGVGGAYYRYGDAGSPAPRCGGATRIGAPFESEPVTTMTAARLRCSNGTPPPEECAPSCEVADDLVFVPSALAGSSSDRRIHIAYGTRGGLAVGPRVEPRPLEGKPRPEGAVAARTGDFNGDGRQDLAVLYRNTQDIHVWVGADNGGLGQVARGIALDACPLAPGACTPLGELVTADFDADGTSELAVICDPTGEARLRRYVPQTP